jgi:hypothetical protein
MATSGDVRQGKAMSTRDDAVLTDAERQAFARLQAQMAAERRPFGFLRLGGLAPHLQGARDLVTHLASRVSFGVAVMVLGVLAVAAGLAWSTPIGVVGLLLVTAGAVPVVERARSRIDTALGKRASR